MSVRDKALESKIDNCIAEIELFKVSNDEMKYLEYLFRIKVDPHYKSIDALREAIELNHLETVKKLMRRFPELHTSNNVIWACQSTMEYNNPVDIPEFILSLGIEFDAELLKNVVCRKKRTDILQLLN